MAEVGFFSKVHFIKEQLLNLRELKNVVASSKYEKDRLNLGNLLFL